MWDFGVCVTAQMTVEFVPWCSSLLIPLDGVVTSTSDQKERRLHGHGTELRINQKWRRETGIATSPKADHDEMWQRTSVSLSSLFCLARRKHKHFTDTVRVASLQNGCTRWNKWNKCWQNTTAQNSFFLVSTIFCDRMKFVRNSYLWTSNGRYDAVVRKTDTLKVTFRTVTLTSTLSEVYKHVFCPNLTWDSSNFTVVIKRQIKRAIAKKPWVNCSIKITSTLQTQKHQSEALLNNIDILVFRTIPCCGRNTPTFDTTNKFVGSSSHIDKQCWYHGNVGTL